MILDLFKPAWQSTNPIRRRKGVQKLNPEITVEADTLFSLASSDPEQTVRLAAIERISNITLLARLLKNAPTSLEQDKLGRLVTLAVLNESADMEGLQKAIDLIDMDDDLIRISMSAASSDAQIQAVNKIYKEENLLKVALDHPLAKLRQLAAEKIQHPTLLNQLLEKVKGKDKSVWRIVKDKIDGNKAEEAALEKRREVAEECFAQIQQLQNKDVDTLLKQKWMLVHTKWKEIPEEDKAHLDASGLIDTITTKVQAFDARSAEEQFQIESKADAENEQQQSLSLITDALNILRSTETSGLDIPSLRATLTTQVSRWETASEMHPPLDHLKSAYERDSKKLSQAINAIYTLREHIEAIKEIHDELHQLMPDDIAKNTKLYHKTEALIQRINWPGDVIIPKDMQRLNTDFQCLEDRYGRQDEILEKLKAQIIHELEKLKAIIESGKLNDADSTIKSIQSTLKKLPDQPAEEVRQELKPLLAQYAELKDWQAFAAQPKKEALISSMEGLAQDTTADVDPGVRLDYIQKLQKEWKELGRLDPTTENELWERFQAASKEAYAPCKAYYEEQANTRERNKAHREKMCDQIDDYLERYNWDNADWNSVQDMVKLAREEWKQYLPVDRKYHRALEDRFAQLIQQLNEKLNTHKQANQVIKQKILDQALTLLENEDLDAAIQTMKNLRTEWRAVGMLPPETYKEMNQSFYDTFNELTARKQKQWSDVEAQKKHNAEQVSQLLNTLEAVINDENPAKVLTSQQELQDAEQGFSEYAPLFEQDNKALRKRFNQLNKDFEKATKAAKNLSKKQMVSDLWHRSQLLRQLEFKVETQNLSTTELNAIKEEWSSIPDSNHQTITTLNARFDAAMKALETGELNILEKANSKSDIYALELCILMEILAETESHEEDAELRLQLQVNRLNQSMQTRKENNGFDEFDHLTLEWCNTGPLSRQNQQELEQRFEQARRHYLQAQS
ncbi:MAG: DUF349 domain-containing protein [Pseudomonadota bacterium]|nr:DUF349 domain-containing protein [Pseudomonadota bacterium]